ncbi:MAG: hypothetical protein DRI34_05385 [Deltaproteobacteria bacterium]|nr:MAG: hypothetical protein DRI34_05385 [Deltaproteobacteria bacterium]
MSADEKKRVAVLLASSRARQLVPELFQQMGLQVEILTAPAELGPAWQSAQHDLLVVDIDMLAADWRGMLEQLRQALPRHPQNPALLVLTGRSLSAEARRALEELGAGAALSTRAPWMEILFAVNRLLFPKMRELRSYSRVFGGFPVQYLYQDRWHQAEVYNISQQGAFIKCDEPAPAGSRLEVRFVLPGIDAELKVAAQVNWVNREQPGPGTLTPSGMGVMFLFLSQADSHSLDRYMEESLGANDS